MGKPSQASSDLKDESNSNSLGNKSVNYKTNNGFIQKF